MPKPPAGKKWRTAFPAPPRAFHNLQQNEYFDVLGELTQEFTMWEITYITACPAMRPCWSGTGPQVCGPIWTKLNKAQQEEFERDVSAQLVQAYPAQRSGEIIFASRVCSSQPCGPARKKGPEYE